MFCFWLRTKYVNMSISANERTLNHFMTKEHKKEMSKKLKSEKFSQQTTSQCVCLSQFNLTDKKL